MLANKLQDCKHSDQLSESLQTVPAGCLSLFGSLVVTVGLSYFFPQNYNWTDMKTIAVFNDISGDVRILTQLSASS